MVKIGAWDYSRLPKHIAVVMDGNGRWAKKRSLPRIYGHREAINSVNDILAACTEIGIKVLTLYSFSTENWSRPKTEVSALMTLLRRYLRSELKKLVRNNIRLDVIGDFSKLPGATREELVRVMKETEKNTGLLLILALNYGSRQEIVRAFNLLSEKKKRNVTEEDISANLYTGGISDPDLIIRTSGEKRLSNFLLWQAAYSELYFTDILWPDFRKKDLLDAIEDFQKRDRRFGGV